MKRPLDKEIAKARQERDLADAKLAILLRAQAELIDAVVAEHRSLDLHTEEESSSIKHMNAPLLESPKKLGRPITSDHPFVARALKLHGSIKAAAVALGHPPATVRSWYATGGDARPIPALTADRLSKRPWLVPRTSWKAIK